MTRLTGKRCRTRGCSGFVIDGADCCVNGHAAKARSRYGNVRTKVGGISFASMLEAERYRELLGCAGRGDVIEIILQPSYLLSIGTADVKPVRWRADFRVTWAPGVHPTWRGRPFPDDAVIGHVRHGGLSTIEDTKGHATQSWVRAMRLFGAAWPHLCVAQIDAKGGVQRANP